MQPEPSADIPMFIPDDMQKAYGSQARRRVRERHAQTKPRPVATQTLQTEQFELADPDRADLDTVDDAEASSSTPTLSHHDRALVVAGGVMAAFGWLGCVGLWSWLALTSSSPIWTVLAVIGAVALLPGVAALVHLWPKREATNPSLSEELRALTIAEADKSPVSG